MNFEMMFYLLIAFIVGRLSKKKVYIGYDEKKYQSADLGIMLKERKYNKSLEPTATTEPKTKTE